MQQQTIKKKRTRLLLDYNQITSEERIKTIKELREGLIKIFKFHIGKQNAINPFDLFEKIFKVDPLALDIYKREYYWNVLKLVIKQLRKENILFIINNITSLYILQTREELNAYNIRVNRHIENLINEKKRAEDWVEEEKWRNIT